MEKSNSIEDTKREYIEKLTEELIFLRTKLGLSQDELGNMLGLSRQTYSTLETKKRMMTWATFLSLIFIFDNHVQTHEIIRNTGLFPYTLFENEEEMVMENSLANLSGGRFDHIVENLDEQAMHAIETVMMIEYARCSKMSGEAVIKAFDGKQFVKITDQDKKIAEAINEVRLGKNHS